MSKLSILTTVTKPDERQDLWWEALMNYCALADEVIVVNGGAALKFDHTLYPKIKEVFLPWPEEWSWEEFPNHMNFGKTHCTGDWILILSIDQLIHEKEFSKLRKIIDTVPKETEMLSLIKLQFVAKMRYFSKNTQPILFRNKPDIGFGFALDFPDGDLCIPIKLNGGTTPEGVPIGEMIVSEHTECAHWNFSYTFKTQEVAKAHYLRMCRAYRRFYKKDNLGTDDESSWKQFMELVMGKYRRAKETATYYEIPGSIRDRIRDLKPEEKGFNIWNNV